MRVLNVLAAIIAPGAGHARAHRVRRGMVWAGLLLLSLATARWTPWLVVIAWLGQVIDAGLIEEGEAHGVAPIIFGLTANAILVGSALLVRSYVVEMFDAPSGSMIPTLLVNDHFAIDKRVHQAHRGDVVVFTRPDQPDTKLVKRVIAVGGDLVEIRNGAVVLNGQPLARRPVPGKCEYDDFSETEARWEQRPCDAYDESDGGRTYRVIYDPSAPGAASMPPRTIPAGSFYVLGDNRDNSLDSRHFGTVAETSLQGRATYIYWSRGRTGVRWSRLQKRVP